MTIIRTALILSSFQIGHTFKVNKNKEATHLLKHFISTFQNIYFLRQLI